MNYILLIHSSVNGHLVKTELFHIISLYRDMIYSKGIMQLNWNNPPILFNPIEIIDHERQKQVGK